MTDQTPIDHADQLWCTLERSYPFLRDLNHDIQEKRKQLQRKEVVISAFGRHNCGKSTLLNAILRNTLLPINIDNETCIEVKIRHDSTVHPGPCREQCPGNDCPRLEEEISTTESVTVARGAATIVEKLHDKNETCRQTGIVSGSGHHSFVLCAFVPILETAPEGWTLALLDTPGFAEANIVHVTARTETLFSTSTAYLYIIDSGNMEDEVDAKKIQLLYRQDKDIFKDSRFIVAVSKYDQRFSQGSLSRARNHSAPRSHVQSAEKTAHDLRQKTLSFISKSLQCPSPPEIEIVPVSALWANTALWLQIDPQQDDVRDAETFLQSYPDSQPQGQGEAATSPLDLASRLDKINGILALETRLKEMIRHCIHIWRTSLAKSYTGYLERAKFALVDHQTELTEERERVAAVLALHARFDTNKGQLCGMAFVEDNQRPDIELKLEGKYAEIDIEGAKRLLHGRIEDMIEALINVMKGKVENGRNKFLQGHFEEEVKRFMQEKAEPSLRAEQLNIKLEGVAGAYRNALDQMEILDREIECIALEILTQDWSPPDNSLRKDRDDREDRDILSDEVLQNRQLTLNDLHKKIRAPPLHIGFFRRFLDRLRKLFGANVTPDGERPYTRWTKEMEEVLDSLKTDLMSAVDTYITSTLRQWVIQEVLGVAYLNRVKRRAQVLMGTYQEAIQEALLKTKEREAKCATDSYMASLKMDIQTLETAITSLRAM